MGSNRLVVVAAAVVAAIAAPSRCTWVIAFIKMLRVLVRSRAEPYASITGREEENVASGARDLAQCGVRPPVLLRFLARSACRAKMRLRATRFGRLMQSFCTLYTVKARRCKFILLRMLARKFYLIKNFESLVRFHFMFFWVERIGNFTAGEHALFARSPDLNLQNYMCVFVFDCEDPQSTVQKGF